MIYRFTAVCLALFAGLWAFAAPGQSLDGADTGAASDDLLLAIGATSLFLILTVWAVVERARFQERARVLSERALLAEALFAGEVPDYLAISADGSASSSDRVRERLGLSRVIRKLSDLIDSDGRAGLAEPEIDRLVGRLEDPHNPGTAANITLHPLTGGLLEGRCDLRELGAEPVLILAFDKLSDPNAEKAGGDEGAIDRMAQNLAQFAQRLPFPAWLRGPSGDLRWVNEAYARAVEADSPDTVITRQIELVRGGGREMDEASISSRAGARSERRNLVIAGERKATEIVELPTAGHDMTLGYARDVSDEEQIRSELHLYTESYAETLERLLSPVAIFNTRQGLEFFNSAFAELWQLSEDWLREKPTHAEVLEALRTNRRLPEQADFPEWKKRTLSQYTELIDAAEEMWHLPDGRTLRVLTQPHPLGGLLLLFDDVTDRLALERSYNTLIAVQRETLENLHEAVVVVGSDGRVKLSNRNFTSLFGLAEDALQSEPHISHVLDNCRDQLVPEGGDWEQARSLFLGIMIGREMTGGRWTMHDRRVIEYGSVPLPDGASLFTCVDITDSVSVEEALRERTEALEEADRLKSQFVASMSHELRTPLNSIIGFTELMGENYAGELNPKQRDYIGSILEASNSLKKLIDEILDLAVIEAGQAALELSEADINALVRRSVDLVRDMSARQDVKFSISEIPDGAMLVDERRIMQAIFNILVNAISYSPEGGKIDIKVSGDENRVTLLIADQGPGVPSELQPQIFDKFFRATFRPSRGTGVGLGLALVKSFIELHGGRVSIRSEEGKGTEVACELPRRAEPDSAGDDGK